jgi:hypothetical protein
MPPAKHHHRHRGKKLHDHPAALGWGFGHGGEVAPSLPTAHMPANVKGMRICAAILLFAVLVYGEWYWIKSTPDRTGLEAWLEDISVLFKGQ